MNFNVSLGDFTRAFQQKTPEQGKLSQSDFAQMALDAKAEGNTSQYNLFATFAMGGPNSKGLTPDTNNDGFVTLAEATAFAKADGQSNNFRDEDFEEKFGTRFKSNFSVDDVKLQAIANGNTTGNAANDSDSDNTAEVNVNKVYDLFAQYDEDQDDILSHQEMAQIALDELDEGNMETFTLFATLVQGGKDGEGFFPEGMSYEDITSLASASGSQYTITSADFKAHFPDDVSEGNYISVSKLRSIAKGNSSSSSGTPNSLAQLLQWMLSWLFGQNSRLGSY